MTHEGSCSGTDPGTFRVHPAVHQQPISRSAVLHCAVIVTLPKFARAASPD